MTDAVSAAGAPFFFGARLWLSLCLGLLIAFWLQLDNPSWAGASAAIVSQPQLGASLRKAWFRMVGTVVGAGMIVVLTACFPQDRIAFLGLLALWAATCAFLATALPNFASYAAALAGYTAVIIAADTLGATGGASSDVFLLAVSRASTICIGIASAAVVFAGTDFGSARSRVATSFADLAAEIATQFSRTLRGEGKLDTREGQREFARRMIAVEPMIDQAIGESAYVRARRSALQAGVRGLFRALDGWREVATHLNRLGDEADRQYVAAVLRNVPLVLQSASGSPESCMSDPIALRQLCEQAVRALLANPSRTPSQRLLADETAKVLAGISDVLDGLALLVNVSDRSRPIPPGPPMSIADWKPAFINAIRAFIAIGAAALFWIVTAWPDGGSAMVFAAIVLLLVAPRGDLAYGGALAFALGTAAVIPCAAIMKFAVLPALSIFPAFCVAIGLFVVPVGFGLARSQDMRTVLVLTVVAVLFMPLIQPTNQMSYDPGQFYNSALPIMAGCILAPLALSLLPPLSPAQRARRLFALTLQDLRRLAIVPRSIRRQDWERRTYARLAAFPDEAEPLLRERLLIALSTGTRIIGLKGLAPRLGIAAEFGAALEAFARGNNALAISQLHQLEHRPALARGTETATALRARGHILAFAEALSRPASRLPAGAVR
ncbi:FUSC family protein [Bradyrhizobium sp. STM 3562]|uniref:FUSC family protein n=1 Tax=Bradyrhizobium sp. STM 3562 TaxID=578924 RepID=UPI00388FE2E1